MFTLRFQTRDVISGSIQLGKLLQTYGADFTGRVDPELITIVVTKPPELDKLFTQTADAYSDKEASTQSKKQQLKETAKYVGDRRKAIARTFPKDPGTRKDFGVGQTLDNDSLDSVSQALEIFTTAARAAPAKSAEAGVIAADIDFMEKTLTSLKAMATVQYEKTASAKQATFERNELQHQLEEAMMKIVGVAALIYDKRPNILGLFKSCLPANKRSKSRRKAGTEAAAEGTVTTTSETE